MKQKGSECSVKAQDTLNASVREAVEEALVQLMRDRSFGRITVSEITQRAGVARSSFYRNYASREDVLTGWMNRIYDRFFADHPDAVHIYNREKARGAIMLRNRFIRENEDFFSALIRSNMLYYVFQHLSPDNKKRMFGINFEEDSYFCAQLIGGTTALVEKWVSSGFEKSEAWMTEYTLRSLELQKKIIDTML